MSDTPTITDRFTLQATSEDVADYMLTSINVPLINLGRIFLEQSTRGVAMVLSHPLSEDELREYCLRLAETLTARAGLEARSQVKMQSNHARLFSDGTA